MPVLCGFPCVTNFGATYSYGSYKKFPEDGSVWNLWIVLQWWKMGWTFGHIARQARQEEPV